MLLEYSLFGTVDKVADAINLLKKLEPPEGYYVAFSGGKDSVVILDLVKRAGVKFEAHHHIMTIEPPELMKFIYKEYPEVINDRPAKTMHQLIVQYGFPPLRQIRYCCWELKSTNGKNRFKVTGVRAEESPRRAKRPKVDISETRKYLNVIHDWTEKDVWEYIHSRNLPYCKLYDEGKKRIGCIFCPFARETENIENALKYPQYVSYFITACERAIKTRTKQGKTSKYNSGAEMFVAWIEGGRGKKLKDFGVIFDYEKGELVMENNEIFDTSTAVVPAENKTSVANIPAENSNAATPAPSLAQRVVKIQFHLQNMAQSAIIIGQELIECKKEIEKEFGYGYWGKWLEDNFHLSQNMAGKFMAIAERFGMSNSQDSATSQNLKQSQMMEMLALTAEDTEKFIAEKEAEGTPVENMTVKKLREEIKDWKAQAEKQKARAEDAESRVRAKQEQYNEMIQTYNRNFFAMREEKDAEAEKLKKENEELKNKPPVEIVRTKTIMPPGYVETVQRAEELQEQVDQLLEQNEESLKTIEDLQNQVIEAVSKQGEPQIDYLQLQEKLAETEAKLYDAQKDAESARAIVSAEKFIELLFQASAALTNSSYYHTALKIYMQKHSNTKDKIAVLRCICQQLESACDTITNDTN